jgi:23S rRNA 5-hydroxycytidine C2501 synthase
LPFSIGKNRAPRKTLEAKNSTFTMPSIMKIKNMPVALELLSPAGNAAIGMAAIDHGADAVYIGAPDFSARADAGNPVEDIVGLIGYAHCFAVRVYVALNTILTDAEIPEALELIHRIHAAGADGLIIQDVGLLECDLPPIPLIASTQMHNAAPEKVKFLESVGFSRVILARELSLSEIKAIREATSIDLEFFVHGALCVSFSGQCSMSQAAFGRSGNRGGCSQPCRHVYSLMDGDGKTIIKNKHLLSLKDLNLSGMIPDLVNAGITSFKIEGRYKDAGYVKNITAAYRREIDRFLAENPGYRRAGSGKTTLEFEPDIEKTFNRGYTRHFISGRNEKTGAIDTPKSLGKAIGTVTAVERDFFRMKGDPVSNGDGLCFFSSSGVLSGFRVNRVVDGRIYPNTMKELTKGLQLYRNHDHEFCKALDSVPAVRKIAISLRFEQTENGISLTAADEDGNQASADADIAYQAPRRPEMIINQITEQLSSTGNTIYKVREMSIHPDQPGFLPLSVLNRLRREALDRLTETRLKRYAPKPLPFTPNTVPYPEKTVDYRANVLNRHARQFYARHGATVAEPALEGGGNPSGKIVMTTRYCLLHQFDACPRHAETPASFKKPLFLTDGRRQYRLSFDCHLCVMHIHLEPTDSSR